MALIFFIKFLIFSSLFIFKFGSADNSDESSKSKADRIWGQIEPEGSYHVYIQAANGKSIYAPYDSKTDLLGNFMLRISEEENKFWSATKFIVTIIKANPADVKTKSVRRILRSKIETGKRLVLQYGATQPIWGKHRCEECNGVKNENENEGRFYFMAKLLDAPEIIRKWSNNGDKKSHGIRMKIKQSFCQLANSDESPGDVIEVGADQIWILKNSENNSDHPQMLVDLRLVANGMKCVAKTENGNEGKIIDGIQIPDQNLILVEKIEISLYADDKQKAYYILRYPALSGADDEGKPYNFYYQLSFADQTEFIRPQGLWKKPMVAMSPEEKDQFGMIHKESAMLNTLVPAWEAHLSDNKIDPNKIRKMNTKKTEAKKDGIAKALPTLNAEQQQQLFDDAVERQAVRAEYSKQGGLANFMVHILRPFCTVFKTMARFSGFSPVLGPLIAACEDSVKMCTFCALSKKDKMDPSKKPKLSTDNMVEGLKKMADGYGKMWTQIKMEAGQKEGIAKWMKRLQLLISRLKSWISEKRKIGIQKLSEMFNLLKWFFLDDDMEENQSNFDESHQQQDSTTNSDVPSPNVTKQRRKRGATSYDYDMYHGATNSSKNCPNLGMMLDLCESDQLLRSKCVYDVWTLRARAMQEMDYLYYSETDGGKSDYYYDYSRPESEIVSLLKSMLYGLGREEVGWTIVGVNTLALLVSLIVTSTGNFKQSESYPNVMVPGEYKDFGFFAYGMSHDILTRRWISDWTFITNPHTEMFSVSHATPIGSLVWGSTLIGVITVYLATFAGYSTVCQGGAQFSEFAGAVWLRDASRRLPTWDRYGWAWFGRSGNDDRRSVW